MEKRTGRVFTAGIQRKLSGSLKAGSGNIAATARELGIDVTTSARLASAGTGVFLNPTLRRSVLQKTELLQLRRDIATLRMEREILKSGSLLAKESR